MRLSVIQMDMRLGESAYNFAHAEALLRRAAEHLDAHRTEFPEYDPTENILKRCSTDGGFVQMR